MNQKVLINLDEKVHEESDVEAIDRKSFASLDGDSIIDHFGDIVLNSQVHE